MEQTKTQFECKRDRYFEDVLALAYEISNAKTPEEMIKLGKSLYSTGITMKFKRNWIN